MLRRLYGWLLAKIHEIHILAASCTIFSWARCKIYISYIAALLKSHTDEKEQKSHTCILNHIVCCVCSTPLLSRSIFQDCYKIRILEFNWYDGHDRQKMVAMTMTMTTTTYHCHSRWWPHITLYSIITHLKQRIDSAINSSINNQQNDFRHIWYRQATNQHMLLPVSGFIEPLVIL